SLLADCRQRSAAPSVREVEALYTDGCAEVLMLEAEHARVKRRLAAAWAAAFADAPPAPQVEVLSERLEGVVTELADVRSNLRQLRAALEWAQSGAEIEESGFEAGTPENGGPRR
ncbi:MAG: hypothetical protein M3131_09620, partial [Actinomycetota bacterium]|nr:hypothetical protein [Actinomycetota bacterium]